MMCLDPSVRRSPTVHRLCWNEDNVSPFPPVGTARRVLADPGLGWPCQVMHSIEILKKAATTSPNLLNHQWGQAFAVCLPLLPDIPGSCSPFLHIRTSKPWFQLLGWGVYNSGILLSKFTKIHWIPEPWLLERQGRVQLPSFLLLGLKESKAIHPWVFSRSGANYTVSPVTSAPVTLP